MHLAALALAWHFLCLFTSVVGMGAGDVKLMGAAGSVLGPLGALMAGALTLISGVAMVVAALGLRRLDSRFHFLRMGPALFVEKDNATRVPYAPAIRHGLWHRDVAARASFKAFFSGELIMDQRKQLQTEKVDPPLLREVGLTKMERMAPRPTKLADTGLSEPFLADLVAKHLLDGGVLRMSDMVERLKLAGPIIESVLNFMRKEARIEVPRHTRQRLRQRLGQSALCVDRTRPYISTRRHVSQRLCGPRHPSRSKNTSKSRKPRRFTVIVSIKPPWPKPSPASSSDPNSSTNWAPP